MCQSQLNNMCFSNQFNYEKNVKKRDQNQDTKWILSCDRCEQLFDCVRAIGATYAEWIVDLIKQYHLH